MESKTIFHTVEDRENIDYVEQNAPFKCKSKSAWLGEGYYFWDSFIELARWWGSHRYNNLYFICKTICSYNKDDVLDLYNNIEQIQDFRKTTTLLKEQFSKRVTVPFVIAFLKEKKLFSYKAIRANAINSFKGSEKLKFVEGNSAYLDLIPAIQICVLDKSVLQHPLKIIYPQKYSEEFTL